MKSSITTHRRGRLRCRECIEKIEKGRESKLTWLPNEPLN